MAIVKMLKTIVIKPLLSGTNAMQMLHTCSLCLIQSLIIGFFSVHQCKFELDAEWEFGSKNSTQQTKYIVFLLDFISTSLNSKPYYNSLSCLSNSEIECESWKVHSPCKAVFMQYFRSHVIWHLWTPARVKTDLCEDHVTPIHQSVMCIHHASRLFLTHPIIW